MVPPAPWLALRDAVSLQPNGAVAVDDKYSEPLSGMVISVILAMVSLAMIASFLTQRFLAVKIWSDLPFVQWLVFAIYGDSFLFVFATGILQFGFGVGYSVSVCESAILLCLACYVTTKLIYMFLVEKAFIIRSGTKKDRLKSKLYIVNSFGMIGIYCVVVVLNFIYRITRVENGQCIIGMQRPAMIPLIAFDLLVNVYLTLVFLIPLSKTYSYKHFQQSQGGGRLRTVAMRTFVGCICTLTSSIVNLSVLMALDGEPGWVCLMCCNSDILFSAVVIQWVTSRDSTSSTSTSDQSHATITSRPPSHTATGTGPGGIEEDEDLLAVLQSSQRIRDTGKPHLNKHIPLASTRKQPSSTKLELVSSTEAIISDAAEIAKTSTQGSTTTRTNSRGDGEGEDGGSVSPGTTNRTTSIYDDKERQQPLAAPRSSYIATTTSDDHRYPRITPLARHTSEVRVDVDYGASLRSRSEIIDGDEDAKLGNSIVIGTGAGVGAGVDDTASGAGSGNGSGRRTRNSPWRYTENSGGGNNAGSGTGNGSGGL
ncbi:hypothetical protein QBC35DRAFT_516091 [Podospora australis]|uniref:Uncharacterized protein n=1 Tax=Podospora australis TaxID=1536484 RepID=A0AAN7AH97_9PEZI|nr:hypothetical protein QBC35DRAFT_516091 [Podospora australis]